MADPAEDFAEFFDPSAVTIRRVVDDLRERTSDPHYAFGREVVRCPECGHGIDPHGVDPGGPCGANCPCLMQPNGIAFALIGDANAGCYELPTSDVRAEGAFGGEPGA